MQGTFTNSHKYHSTLKLDINNVKWHTTENKWGEDTYYQNNGLWGAYSVTSGSYVSQVYDIGEVLTSIMGYEFGYSSEDETAEVKYEWRYSNDNITWSDWLSCNNGGYTFRYCQFRVLINSSNNIPVVVNKFRVTVDVPDKETELDVVIDENGELTIAYDFISVPSIIGTVNDDIEAYVVVTEKTNKGV